MDEAQNGRRYAARDKVQLEIVLYHMANLKEVRVIFGHMQNNTAAPLMARGIDEIINNPELVHVVREQMEQAFGEGESARGHQHLTSDEES